MQVSKQLIICLATVISLSVAAHDIPVHKAITKSAIESAMGEPSGYSGFLQLVAPDLPTAGLSGATNVMILGSGLEDNINVPGDVGGERSINHFYDPLDGIYGKGLSDAPPDRRSVVGINSFAWGSVSNSLGYNYEGEFYIPFFGKNVNKSNIWSWPNARGYEWIGLTATNKNDRFAALTNMFRSVGQVMHLLEDASQPQHVRNEQHLDTLGTLFWESPIEDYGRDNFTNNPQWFVMPPNAIIGWANWQAAGFNKLEDFWDRHLYAPGSATALRAAENSGAQLGLAEWCNGNFLGDRHTYANFFPSTSIKYYPHPAFADTSLSRIEASNLLGTAVIDTTTLENGKQGERVYISQTKTGVNIIHQSAMDYFAVLHPPRLNVPGMQVALTIRDANVLQEYHNLFIPKAVEYSAGLIDYFFRGTISGQITDYDTNTMQYTVSIQNTSNTNFGGGSFYFQWGTI